MTLWIEIKKANEKEDLQLDEHLVLEADRSKHFKFEITRDYEL